MTYLELKNLFSNKLTTVYEKTECDELFYLSIEKYDNLSKTDYILNSQNEIDNKITQTYLNILSRLTNNEPIQYILEEAWFMNRKFFVNNNVLIPRQETEELIVTTLKTATKESEIIDLGTGSGCIAISLALESNSALTAIDKSEKALEVAKKNAKSHNVDVRFMQLDMLTNKIFDLPKFDIIVSNPPYVTIGEKNKMMNNVLDYEPEIALFVDDNNPLKFYIAIKEFASKNLKNNGRVIMEINEMFGNEVSELFKSDSTKTIIHKDIHGKDRFVEAIY